MKIIDQELTVKRLIENAESEKVWLPEFQRPFVWDDNQISLLIDSLFNNYTISSILIWEGGDELARRRVGANMKEIKVPENRDESVIYILDGQQRISALLLAFTDKPVFKHSYVKKIEKLNIYWDSEYNDDDPELRWILDNEKIKDPDNADEKICLKDFSEDALYEKFHTRFVKIKHAYKLDDERKKELFGEDYKSIYEYSEKLNVLKERILSRRVYDIEQKGSLEQVLEVFERINTRNTKLSIFDIMVAKTYRKFDDQYFDLRSYYKIINYTDSIKPDYFENKNNIDLDKVSLLIDETELLFITLIIAKTGQIDHLKPE